MATQIKNEVLYRVYAVMVIVVAVAVLIMFKAVKISVMEGEKWRQMGWDKYVQPRSIEADRGNILASDGSLLATSLPFYDLAFDPNSSGMTEADFVNNIDSLSYCLATFIDPTRTPGSYRDYLVQKRLEGSEYVTIKRNVTFAEMQLAREFPLFNKGQFRGGMIATPKYKRDRPFGLLAHRTVGYVREGIKPVGLEGRYNEVLAGKAGRQMMMRVEEGIWKPIDNLAQIEPESGKDIKTTIDVDLQDIAEEALFKAVGRHDASHGVAIVMEVKTGAVRAIANLGRTKDGELWETYNHAIGSATEPGSTFKAATMMALLEQGLVELTDTVQLDEGKAKFYNETLEDSSPHGLEATTVAHAFEISSNVGMARLVQEKFGDTNEADKFIETLKSFNLHLLTGVEIDGEAPPYIKEANSVEDNWSGTTLPWMAIGYEVTLTPLQILTFYNTIANDGLMMKPYLVSEVQEYGMTLERFPPTVVKRKLASRSTIEKMQGLLEGVVLRGTARKHQTDRYSFAGKTGTAQVNYKKLRNQTRVGGYQATFAGYFPAEEPLYSCIVMISNPKKGGFYGGDVALPVFREIADRTFGIKKELLPVLNDYGKPALAARTLPSGDIGSREELEQLLTAFEVDYESSINSKYAVLKPVGDTLRFQSRTIPKDIVPNVVGMGLKDALYILENKGLKVEVQGYGKVVQQSILPGTDLRGQTIRLKLG